MIIILIEEDLGRRERGKGKRMEKRTGKGWINSLKFFSWV